MAPDGTPHLASRGRAREDRQQESQDTPSGGRRTMTGTWCLVVNPAAGRGRGTRVLPAVLGALARGPGGPAGIRVSQTTGLAGAARTAVDAAGHGETVVAVGGDGLVGTLAAALGREGAP